MNVEKPPKIHTSFTILLRPRGLGVTNFRVNCFQYNPNPFSPFTKNYENHG